MIGLTQQKGGGGGGTKQNKKTTKQNKNACLGVNGLTETNMGANGLNGREWVN